MVNSIEVYDPTGSNEAIVRHAPRLSDLNGKTICELSDRGWEDFRTFPLIRKLLQNRFPDARIIPYTEFPITIGIKNEVLSQVLSEKSCDAIIVGNAA